MSYDSFSSKANSILKPIIIGYKKYFGFFFLVVISSSLFLISVNKLRQSLNTIAPISDEYYFERVFYSGNQNWIVGHPFHLVESSDLSSTEIISIGESIARLMYILLDNNIILTYLLFSFLCLFITIVFLVNFLNIEGKSFKTAVGVTFIAFFILFSRFSPIPSDSLQFSRMISPQFAICLWSFEIYLIAKIIRAISHGESFNKAHISFTFVTIVSLYAHYPYLFFCSIIAFILLQFKIQKTTKTKRYIFFNFIILSLGCLPHIVHLFRYRNTVAYNETLVRIGLIDTRFPGSLYIICTSLIIFILVKIIEKNISNRKTDHLKIHFSVLKMITLTILLASQSNIVSGYSIQFSDHFNILMNINLIALFGILVLFFQKNFSWGWFSVDHFNLSIKLRRVVRSTGFFLLIFIFYTTISAASHPLNYVNYQSHINSIFSKYNVDRVIVDTGSVPQAGLQQTVGAISGRKILYSSTLLGYGFTNKEVLDRYWISSGCPNNLGTNEINTIYGYTIVASEQKNNRIDYFLKFLPFELFENYLENRKASVSVKQESIKADISEYLISNKTDCLNLAKSFDIDAIIFSSDSKWYEIIIKHNFTTFKLNNGLFVSIVSSKNDLS